MSANDDSIIFSKSSLTQRSPTKDNVSQNNQVMAQANNDDRKIDALQEQMKEMMAMLKEANESIKSLTAENIDLRRALDEKLDNHDLGLAPAASYATDTDELEDETNWSVSQSKKSKRAAKRQKRKAGSSPEALPQEKKQTSPATEAPKAKKELPPPPINVIGIKDHAKIKELIANSEAGECKLISLRNDVWKINTSTPDHYRKLAEYLKNEGLEWYTYEDKNSRPIKVMARGLHPSCDPLEIIEDIKEKGLQILNATNIKKRVKATDSNGYSIMEQRSLPLFMLTFKKEEDIHNIFTISSILSIKVKIEALRKATNIIPQCKKCQGFNHTEKYCHKNIKCVKCANNHLTKDCQLERKQPATCTNCKGQHPASYRGCEVAVELQKIRDKATKAKKIVKNQTKKNEGLPKTPAKSLQEKSLPEKSLPENTSRQSPSYSQALKLVSPLKQSQEILRVNQDKTQTTLEAILQKLETISARIDSNTEKINICFDNFKTLTGYLEQKKSWRDYTNKK